ncbi:hypothetical protein B0H17DRAFT_1219629 [Mycena rosella]|uniref:Uncharacterized protein n=1 Tax=Mycena rosella TaxID=1033263 RepID=A0AAD7FEV8_MYCRO|nr:hypothetical protein B0H17DRAFT_1219629 [Mycena rosella]
MSIPVKQQSFPNLNWLRALNDIITQQPLLYLLADGGNDHDEAQVLSHVIDKYNLSAVTVGAIFKPTHTLNFLQEGLHADVAVAAAQANAPIVAHMGSHLLHFSPLLLHRNTITAVEGSPTWHALQLQAFDWTMVQVIVPVYRSITEWGDDLHTYFHGATCCMQAPTTVLPIEALLIHIASFFGGDTYQLGCLEDNVIINSLGWFGLVPGTGAWTVGESFSHGIVKNTLTELMHYVFADTTVWKKIGNVYVIDLVPTSTEPDLEHMRRLKTYGYACMLHVVIHKSLPISLSTLFAYAILQANGDIETLKDTRFLRAAAPAKFDLLQTWPTKPALTLQYFDKTPEMLAALSPEMLKGYTTDFHRWILYGSSTPFPLSNNIRAFETGFNAQLTEASPMTLAKSFGSSLKSIILKLAAARIESVADVIERLTWRSSYIPCFSNLEECYKLAMIRYLSGKGVVCHSLLQDLTAEELSIAPDDPTACVLMFLMTVTGTQQLPQEDAMIQVH